MPASDLVTPAPEASPAADARAEAPAGPSDEAPAGPSDEAPARASDEAPARASDEAPAAPPRPSREARREVIATLAIVGTILSLALARPLVRRLARRPSVEQCAAMLAHYAEEQARAVRLARAFDAAEGTRALKSEAPPAGERSSAKAAERCSRELTAEEVDCAVHAGNVDEIERCLPLP